MTIDLKDVETLIGRILDEITLEARCEPHHLPLVGCKVCLAGRLWRIAELSYQRGVDVAPNVGYD